MVLAAERPDSRDKGTGWVGVLDIAFCQKVAHARLCTPPLHVHGGQFLEGESTAIPVSSSSSLTSLRKSSTLPPPPRSRFSRCSKYSSGMTALAVGSAAPHRQHQIIPQNTVHYSRFSWLLPSSFVLRTALLLLGYSTLAGSSSVKIELRHPYKKGVSFTFETPHICLKLLKRGRQAMTGKKAHG